MMDNEKLFLRHLNFLLEPRVSLVEYGSVNILKVADRVSLVKYCFVESQQGDPMPRQPLESLGALVREKRGKKKLRETAHEIGIGAATLMRIENGRVPDIETFRRICVWLKTDPNSFLGFKNGVSSPSSENATASISAHFRAEQNPKQATVDALAKMVLYTLKAQPRFSDSDL
jgi:transcriptional regulator with XRE-family HTH domain